MIVLTHSSQCGFPGDLLPPILDHLPDSKVPCETTPSTNRRRVCRSADCALGRDIHRSSAGALLPQMVASCIASTDCPVARPMD